MDQESYSQLQNTSVSSSLEWKLLNPYYRLLKFAQYLLFYESDLCLEKKTQTNHKLFKITAIFF